MEEKLLEIKKIYKERYIYFPDLYWAFLCIITLISIEQSLYLCFNYIKENLVLAGIT